MSTTDHPAFFPGTPSDEPDIPPPARPDPEAEAAPGAGEAGLRLPDGDGPAADRVSRETDEPGETTPDSDELAASLTDRLIQYWRTGETGDAELLPDAFYGASPEERPAGGETPPDDGPSGIESANVLDLLPRRGPLPDLRNAWPRPAAPANDASQPARDEDFSLPGLGRLGGAPDPFAAVLAARDGDPDADGGLRGAFERIPSDNPFRADSLFGRDHPFGTGGHPSGDDFATHRAPSQDASPAPEQARHNAHHDAPHPRQAPEGERPGKGMLAPRPPAIPARTQEERPPARRKAGLEVAFIYGSALALAAAVMGAIYLSNEGMKGKMGAPGQQNAAPGLSGMPEAESPTTNGAGGMPGYGPGVRPAAPAAQGAPRAFEAHDAVGFPGRPIALSIVLPRPLGESDAFVSIGGLPDAAQLSAGTRMASGLWMLRFEDVEGLMLRLPESAPAEINAEAAILRQDGGKSFERNFRISVASQGRDAPAEAAAAQLEMPIPERESREKAPPAAAEPPRMTADVEKAVLGRAKALLDQGDISAARLMLEHGAVKGCVDCGFNLAQICDPIHLGRLDVWGVQPDIEKALRWYAWAARHGHPKAAEAQAKLKQKILSDIPGN